ncbi:hypothetical protein ETECTG_CDS0020 [Escherichia phage ETEC-TG]|nr:hypothetical protein ETECTG_CDS0020 [Escherichia phage ETEC-TG]
MTLSELKTAYSATLKIAVRYRDEYGFIAQGVILGFSDDGLIYVDAHHNKVKPENIISIKYL